MVAREGILSPESAVRGHESRWRVRCFRKKPAIDGPHAARSRWCRVGYRGCRSSRISRVRPEDLIVNRDEGAEWLAENFGLPIEAVREILSHPKVPAAMR